MLLQQSKGSHEKCLKSNISQTRSNVKQNWYFIPDKFIFKQINLRNGSLVLCAGFQSIPQAAQSYILLTHPNIPSQSPSWHSSVEWMIKNGSTGYALVQTEATYHDFNNKTCRFHDLSPSTLAAKGTKLNYL